jgi:HEPN domain-containing protein
MPREEIEDWFEEGLNDFKNAKTMVTVEIYNVATFYCEQALQKLLKATWMKIKRTYPPKSHKISYLGAQLNAPPNIINLLNKIAPFYFISKYPDAANGVPSKIITKETAQEIVQATTEVIQWIKTRI